MADDDKKEPEKSDDEGTVSFKRLKEVVKEVVSDMLGNDDDKNTTSEASAPQDSIKAEVRAALAEVQKGDKERTEKQTAADRLKAIEEKIAEKPPIERSRSHKFMGWGE